MTEMLAYSNYGAEFVFGEKYTDHIFAMKVGASRRVSMRRKMHETRTVTVLEKCRRGVLGRLADVLDCKSIADGSTPGRDRVRDFSVLTNQHFFRFVSACLAFVCMTQVWGNGCTRCLLTQNWVNFRVLAHKQQHTLRFCGHS